jgi:hypothetical protein
MSSHEKLLARSRMLRQRTDDMVVGRQALSLHPSSHRMAQMLEEIRKEVVSHPITELGAFWALDNWVVVVTIERIAEWRCNSHASNAETVHRYEEGHGSALTRAQRRFKRTFESLERNILSTVDVDLRRREICLELLSGSALWRPQRRQRRQTMAPTLATPRAACVLTVKKSGWRSFENENRYDKGHAVLNPVQVDGHPRDWVWLAVDLQAASVSEW